ncbi:MAG TPA: nucleoside hydrolase, partial [Gammaproteobacteria bacterium]|nr:nucleoside hydrolase [Gammaproteobacteria bacterium]
GGAINVPGNVHEADPSLAQQKAEWNFYIDPYAAQQVLNSGVAITLVPLDVTNQVPLDMNFYKQIESWGNTAEGSFLYNLLTQNKAMLLNHLWYFWDPLAAAIAVNPSIAKIKTLPITVVQEPEIWSGATVVDRHKGRPIQVCMKVDSRKFKSLLLEMTI